MQDGLGLRRHTWVDHQLLLHWFTWKHLLFACRRPEPLLLQLPAGGGTKDMVRIHDYRYTPSRRSADTAEALNTVTAQQPRVYSPFVA